MFPHQRSRTFYYAFVCQISCPSFLSKRGNFISVCFCSSLSIYCAVFVCYKASYTKSPRCYVNGFYTGQCEKTYAEQTCAILWARNILKCHVNNCSIKIGCLFPPQVLAATNMGALSCMNVKTLERVPTLISFTHTSCTA